MTIVNSIINWINYKRIYEIDLYREHAREIQEEVLFNLLNAAKGTEWGEKYDYANTKSWKCYKDRVPISRYETIEPLINRMIQGDKNVLWPGAMKWFAKSSEQPTPRVNSSRFRKNRLTIAISEEVKTYSPSIIAIIPRHRYFRERA